MVRPVYVFSNPEVPATLRRSNARLQLVQEQAPVESSDPQWPERGLMRSTLVATLLFIAAAALLSGCVPEPRRVLAGERVCFAAQGACRFHDVEAAVTCWTTNDSRGGVFCMPDAQVALGARR
jgi:hypothetical protein